MTDVEEQISTVLTSQANAMRVPEVVPGERLARVVELPPAPRRPAFAVAIAAAVVLVLAGGVALTQRDAKPPTAVLPASNSIPLHFATPTVVMDAASVDVITADRTWVPTSDLVVDGDPGILNTSTTLELTWYDNGIEQRINIYFVSDGVDWWANEIRTYDGEPEGEWIAPIALGEFFRSPLGTAFVGDLDLPNLRIHGMTLQAFRRPSVCDNPAVPVALLADFPRINATIGEFGTTFQIIDTATCTAIPVAPYTFEYASDNPTIVSVDPAEEIPGYPPTKTRISLRLVANGQVLVHATVRNGAGDIVDSTDMHITVGPSLADTSTGDTLAPSITGG